MSSVVKYYCDRQSCKRELPKNGVIPVEIHMKRIAVYPETGNREINVRVDLCRECAEELKNYLEEFFNKGGIMYEQMGEGPIKVDWEGRPSDY